MRSRIAMGLGVAILALLVVLANAAFRGSIDRQWWFFSGNDACQAFSAQSASMRLGAPIQSVVWPGATLPTAYLYWQAFFGEMPAQPMTVESTEALLAESVHFHWTQAATYGLVLLLLVYALGTRGSGSPVLGLAAAALLACNEWFLWALFHVRPEVPSIVFVLAACWWADSRRNVEWTVVRPVVFGVLIGLAILSKIQIVPVIPLAIWLYVRRDRQEVSDIGWPFGAACRWIAAGLMLAGALAMLRTKAIDGAGYGLPNLPSTFAHVCFGAVVASVVGLVLLGRRGRSSVAQFATRMLLVGAGMTVALLLLVLPILWFGGAKTAWVSANRMVYGTLSFARYGLQLDAEGGWGLKGGIVDRARSFIDFQTSSATYGWNPAIWTGLVLVACALLTTSWAAVRTRGDLDRASTEASDPSRIAFGMGLALYLSAVLCDIATTHRTVSTTSYAFYHIFSLPLYLMSLAASVGGFVLWFRQVSVSLVSTRIAGIAAMILIGVGSTQLLLQTSRMKQWEAGVKPAATYFGEGNSTKVIGGVAPEFWQRTGVAYDALRDYVLHRDITERSQDGSSPK